MYPGQAIGPARSAVGAEGDVEHPRPASMAQGGQGLTAEWAEQLQRASRGLETASPEEIITWAVEHHFPRLTMATAFGPEGCVILSMLARIEPRVYVFNLDTGYQFQETLTLRDRIAERYGMWWRWPGRVERRDYERGTGSRSTSGIRSLLLRPEDQVLREHVRDSPVDSGSAGTRVPTEPRRRSSAGTNSVGEDQSVGQLDKGAGLETDHGENILQPASPPLSERLLVVRGQSCFARMSAPDAGAGRQTECGLHTADEEQDGHNP